MAEYTVTMVRSPGITEDERKKRLRQAFDILLGWGRQRIAALDTVGGQDQDSDTPVLLIEPGTRDNSIPRKPVS